jgi:hypothetical protein
MTRYTSRLSVILLGMKSSHTGQQQPMGVRDPVDLNDSVWTLLHIAFFLGQSPDRVLSVVNSFGFPVPLANQKRNRRWLASDVKEFFNKRSQGLLQVNSNVKVNRHQSPKSMGFKK